MHLIYLDILCTESDIYWRKQNWIFTFQTTSLPNFQTNCTVLKIIPNSESKERFYLVQYSVKSGLFWVSFFQRCPLGKKWLWGSYKISHKQCGWRSLENTILAHYLKGKTEVLNNHKPLIGRLKQNSFVTNSLKTCLENM